MRIAFCLGLLLCGCDRPSHSRSSDNGDATNGAGAGGTGGGAAGGCVGPECPTDNCGETDAVTSLSGVVYDPAGNNPLYNVVVFVPGTTPEPLPTGASCDSCSSLYSGKPGVVALTDAAGRFQLQNVPVGDNIPLVIQIGKWRRQLVVPHVVGCVDNVLPDKTVRLPRNGAEGDIPEIAISTGGADTLECLLLRIGLDESEYTGGAGGRGHVHIFQGNSPDSSIGFDAPNTDPPGPSSPSGLWRSAAELMKYDMLLLSCEGDETTSPNREALHDYASAGGRVFASHFHYAWFNRGPYAAENLATWMSGPGEISDLTANIVTSFPKGGAFKQWLGHVGALASGELPITDARHNADVTSENRSSQAWIVADEASDAPGATQYFSFNTPTNAPPDDGGAPQYCGRVVYSDLHVGAASSDYNGGLDVPEITPSGCRHGPLTPQEAALEFMLFDLSSCVTPDAAPPQPPIM